MFCGTSKSQPIQQLNKNYKDKLHLIDKKLRIIKVRMERIEALNKKILNEEKIVATRTEAIEDDIVSLTNQR